MNPQAQTKQVTLISIRKGFLATLLAMALSVGFAFQKPAVANPASSQNPPLNKPVPSWTHCREVVGSNQVMVTSFFAPFDVKGVQKTMRLLRTMGALSEVPNDPSSSEDPVPAQRVIFDHTVAISSTTTEGVAYFSPSGFVKFFGSTVGEVVFALPNGPEIALIAQNCVFPEPGVVIGN